MDWSKPLHLQIEAQVVALRVAAQRGMPWKENLGIVFGIFKVIAAALGADIGELKKLIVTAEKMVGERNIRCKEDLNVGDLTTLQVDCDPDEDDDDAR